MAPTTKSQTGSSKNAKASPVKPSGVVKVTSGSSRPKKTSTKASPSKKAHFADTIVEPAQPVEDVTSDSSSPASNYKQEAAQFKAQLDTTLQINKNLQQQLNHIYQQLQYNGASSGLRLPAASSNAHDASSFVDAYKPQQEDESQLSSDDEEVDPAAAQLQIETARAAVNNSGKSPAKSGTGSTASKRSLVAPSGAQQPSAASAVSFAHHVKDAHSMASTPESHLTPQERKDLALDKKIMNSLTMIRNKSYDLCNAWFGSTVDEKPDQYWNRWAEKEISKEFISYAACVAEGGPRGAQGWRDLVTDGYYCKALAHGIVQRVLKEFVFGSLLFGAPEDLAEELDELEKEQSKDHNAGFLRASSRANSIKHYEIRTRIDLNKCPSRLLAESKLALQIFYLLRPLFILRHTNKQKDIDPVLLSLLVIVKDAANQAYIMRKNGDTVIYHFLAVFKDTDVEPVMMDVLNEAQLKDQFLDAEKKKKKHMIGDFLVQMVCGFQLLAVRNGGGVMAERIIEEEEQQPDYSVAPELRRLNRHEYKGRIITANDGFRTKVLAKASVFARFGRKRPSLVGEEAFDGDQFLELQDAVEKGRKRYRRDGECVVM